MQLSVAYCNLKNGVGVHCFVGDVYATDHRMNLMNLGNRSEIHLSLKPISCM